MERLFKGVYGIVLTPFKDDGDIDYDALEKQADRAVSRNALDGLVVCGSTGEFTRLSYSENIQIMDIVRSVSRGKTQFICGATAGDSYNANRYIEHISKIGADGVLLAPPYYFKLNDDEIFEYYNDVMVNNSGRIPIIGYNIPQCTSSVSVPVFDRLLQYKSFKGFKNSWNDMQEITSEIAIRDEKRKDVSMMTGLDACLYGTLALGGDGIFSAITYLMPETVKYIYQNFGKTEKAFKCQCDLIKLINMVNNFTFPYGYRVLSDAIGSRLGKGREAIPLNIRNKTVTVRKEMRDFYDKMCFEYKL